MPALAVLLGVVAAFATLSIGISLGNALITPTSTFAQSDLTPEQEAKLRAELADIENQIKQQQTILTQKAGEGVSIQRDISILNARIKQAQLKIKAKELSINKLGKDITIKTNTITALGTRIDRGRESLQQIIQRTREIDNFSYAEAMLSTKDISEFFIDLDSFASIKQSLQTHLDDIKNAKSQNENVKKELDTKRNEEIDTKISIEKEKKIIEKSEAEKKRLLALNKNEQANYKTSIANNSARAAQIRNQLFKLRDAAAIKFGDAVAYAKSASAVSGTRAAFILAIIQQESSLGLNVGRCYLTDINTGAGIHSSSGKVYTNLMKASRDVQPFLDITSALGRDPLKTLVSCPQSVGYGGAMGPAQFIPSTWKLFQNRIASALGKPASDPWNPQDAFMASGFYLADLGASAQTYTAERNAACRYYSGRSCSGSVNTTYGNQVMARVKTIQDNIDILGGN
jgi:membrane-bound lytic murein transglycosylase B